MPALNYLLLILCSIFAFSEEKNDSFRIVGGNEADIKDFPYQLALSTIEGSVHVCGASLIAPNVALCAAHCVVWFPGVLSSTLRIRAGSSNRKEGGQLVKVSQVHKHPNFNLTTYDYDVSILELEEEITIENSDVIQLVEADEIIEEGQIATVSGWGRLEEDNITQPLILHSVEIPIVNHDVCNEALDGQVTDRMLCAGIEGKDTCTGDSGGPLTFEGKLIGIVSWGNGCAQGYPKTFTSVGNPEIREYIREIVGL